MEHNHGNEYQVKVIHDDGTEQLSRWMNSEAQIALAIASIHRPQGACWLRERKVVCLDCPDREQRILEYRVVDTPSQRCHPHDSQYLLAAGYKNRYELCEEWWHRAEVESGQPQPRAFRTAA